MAKGVDGGLPYVLAAAQLTPSFAYAMLVQLCKESNRFRYTCRWTYV